MRVGVARVDIRNIFGRSFREIDPANNMHGLKKPDRSFFVCGGVRRYKIRLCHNLFPLRS